MTTSDVIALIAVVIAAFSLIQSFLSWNKQKRYIKTQDDLNLMLLQKEKKDIDSSNIAELSANIVKMGRDISRIRIFNKGKGRATKVGFSIPEGTNWIILNDIFPLEYLESGQSADL